MRYGVHLTECRDWGRLAQRKGKEQQEGWARRFQRLGNGGSCHAGGEAGGAQSEADFDNSGSLPAEAV